MLAQVQPAFRPAVTLLQLWWNGVVRPNRAFEEVGRKPAPAWSFRVVLLFNLAVSLTSLLALERLDRQPFLPSWLTIVPSENYYRFEIFFLPVVGTAHWLLGSAILHLGLRLSGRPSDMDLFLNSIWAGSFT